VIYEPNDKHKPVPTSGRRGSICPRDVDSEALLRGSGLAPNGGKRFNTDGERAYCAQRHDPERDAWHGYPIAFAEVPPPILKEWLGSGRVERRAVRREAGRS
jgi:hypothetical protein